MSSKKGKKGSGGLGKSLIGGIVSLAMIGVVLAALQLMGITNLIDSFQTAKEKSLKYSECMPNEDCGLIPFLKNLDISGKGSNLIGDLDGKGSEGNNGIDLNSPDGVKFEISRDTDGYRGPEKGEPYVTNSGLVAKDTSLAKLETLKVVSDKDKDVGYSRSEWKHWTSVDNKSCWNTREEVLNRDAIPGTIKYVDKKKNTTGSYDEACAIGIPVKEDGKVKVESENSGEWIDPYTGKKIKSASEVDIDHIIPLSNAARNGGQNWTPEKKERFANDLDNLLSVSAKENRTKSDKGPAKYMPPNKNYQCQYSKQYISIANKYSLSITESDYKILKEKLNSCKN